jgi:hypothetical protein
MRYVARKMPNKNLQLVQKLFGEDHRNLKPVSLFRKENYTIAQSV